MECEHILEGYFNFLKKNLTEIREKEFCKLELPFPRPAGDFIQLSIKEIPNGGRLISDEGFIFDYLFSYGIDLWKLTADSMKEILSRTIKRYDVQKRHKPDIVIKSSKETLFQDIFRMSNILNELASLKLLVTPAPTDLFRRTVETYFGEKRLKYSSDPKIKIEIQDEPFSFQLDFLFEEKKTYTKIITSDSIVKDWAVNFDQIRKNSEEDLVLWALYNDKDNVKSTRLNAFLGDYADAILAWSVDKRRFEELK